MSIVFLWGLPFTNCYSLLVLLNLSTASSPCEISNRLWRREMSAVFSGGSRGGDRGTRGARGPPYFQTKLRPEGPIKFFLETAPAYLRVCMTAPLQLYLKVWIWHWFSQATIQTFDPFWYFFTALHLISYWSTSVTYSWRFIRLTFSYHP